jgi:homoserine O-acetyltransferase
MSKHGEAIGIAYNRRRSGTHFQERSLMSRHSISKIGSVCSVFSMMMALFTGIVSVTAQAAAPVETAPQQFAQLGDVVLENHGVIHDCTLGYRTVGKLNADKSNAILFLPWHTASSAEALGAIGPKGFFDPSPYYVIIVDAIGNGVSCSPSNSKTQHGPAFPRFSIRDMVESEYQLVNDKLGIHHLHATIGFSLGGMQTFQWMVSHPDFMDVAIPISGTPRQSSYDKLVWHTLDDAITADPDYAQGNYQKNPALPLFQLMFSMNFTSPSYHVEHTPTQDFDKFYQETIKPDDDGKDTNDMRWQLLAILSQDVADGGSLQDAAKKVEARVHVIVSKQDHLANPQAALEFAQLVHGGTTTLASNCGHIAALSCETDKTRAAIEKALSGKKG